MGDRQTFRSPFAIVIWWVWVLFAAGNLIDLAVQGRDHLTVVAALILLLITGLVYATAQRPRIVADDGGLTIANPLRDHRIGWGAVAGIDAAELVRVRCEWPVDGAPDAAPDAAGTGKRVIYSWAVHSSRRRQVTAALRAERPRLRPRGTASPGAAASYGAPAQTADPPTAGDTGPVVAALAARAEQARMPGASRASEALGASGAPDSRPQAGPPVSSWYWPALAAIVIPALALVIAILV